MWYVYYDRALEIARERADEAARDRLARGGREPASSRSRFDGLRRNGAVIAVWIARRLDECVAREELRPRSIDDRLGLPG
jgi:hypothetical protein